MTTHQHTATLLTRSYAENKITILSPQLTRFGSGQLPLPLKKIKLKMKGTFFEDIPAVQSACTGELKSIPQTEFSRVFDRLYKRSTSVYVEEGSM